MANRVLLGQRGSDYGLWVSKPGQNVLTANADQLLFSPDTQMLQVIYSDVIRTSGSGGNATYTRSWTNPGFYPFVMAFVTSGWCYVTYNSQSSVNVQVPNNFVNHVYIIVFNVPRHP